MGAGLKRHHGPLPISYGLSVPPHTELEAALPWWALVFALVADAQDVMAGGGSGRPYLWIAALAG